MPILDIEKTILRLVFFKFNLDWSMLVILKIFNKPIAMVSKLLAMASILIAFKPIALLAMASILIAFKPIAMASKLLAMASILIAFNPIAMASKLLAMASILIAFKPIAMASYLRWPPS